MRFAKMIGMSAVLFLMGIGDAAAAPVELVCKYSGDEAHLYIDLDAGTVVWNDHTFKAEITDTKVDWSGFMPLKGLDVGPDIIASFDRDTGTLSVFQPAGYDAATDTHWGESHAMWACAKAQKVL